MKEGGDVNGESHGFQVGALSLRSDLTDVVLSPCRGADGYAVPGLGVSGHILHVAAEIDLFLTGLAEADVALVGRFEIFPELGTLEPEGDGTVGDGGLGDHDLDAFSP